MAVFLSSLLLLGEEVCDPPVADDEIHKEIFEEKIIVRPSYLSWPWL